MRHQHHFNATLESLYSVEALSEQYEQGLRDADSVISFESLLTQGDESCTEQLLTLGNQYGVESVSMEGVGDKLKALLVWAKDVLKKILAYIEDVFSRLTDAVIHRVNYLRKRNAKLKTAKVDKVEVDAEAHDAFRSANARAYVNAAAHLSHCSKQLMEALGKNPDLPTLYPKIEAHWQAFCVLYPNKTDLAACLRDAQFPSHMLRTYKQLLVAAGSEKLNISHAGARPGRALVSQMELEDLSKKIDEQLDAIAKAAEVRMEETRECLRRSRQILDDIQRKHGKSDDDTAQEQVRAVVEGQGVLKASNAAGTKKDQEELSTLGSIMKGIFGGIDDLGVIGGGL